MLAQMRRDVLDTSIARDEEASPRVETPRPHNLVQEYGSLIESGNLNRTKIYRPPVGVIGNTYTQPSVGDENAQPVPRQVF
jgi:hypothetical protein